MSLFWPYRLTVRTSAFQAGNPGSIPGRVTPQKLALIKVHFCVVTLSKQTALFASGNRSPIRFSVLTETNGDTGSVRTDKRTRGPGRVTIKKI